MNLICNYRLPHLITWRIACRCLCSNIMKASGVLAWTWYVELFYGVLVDVGKIKNCFSLQKLRQMPIYCAKGDYLARAVSSPEPDIGKAVVSDFVRSLSVVCTGLCPDLYGKSTEHILMKLCTLFTGMV